jgi:Bacterial conjugation TrbI-like protein
MNFKKFKLPIRKLIIFLAIMIIAYIGLHYVFDKKDTLEKHAKKAISKPFEVIYKAPMSDISSDKNPDIQPQETEKSYNTEKKDLKPESPKKPERNIPPSKSNQVLFLPNNGRKGRRNMAVKPFTPPIGLYTAKPSSIPPNPKDQSAPFGQLLRCELIQTVMTSNLQTPIIAMVTEPLWWNGKEIIPAGVIVHGIAASSPMRDRVGTGTKWVLVWPHRNKWNGKRLVLNAIALACDRTENSWAKIDGSAGIKGDVISNENQKRMYAYMTSFISGLGEGMVSENEDITGSTTTKTTGGTFSDALGKAFQKSASDISDQLFKELSQNMFYVEARAGTEFYLYIKQDIRISEAKKGQLIIQTSSRRKRK